MSFDSKGMVSMRELGVSIDVKMADRLLSLSSTLKGAGEALEYRAAADNDDMLALIASIITDQASALRALVR